ITDAGVVHLKGLLWLTSLELDTCFGITGTGFKHVELPILSRLRIHGCHEFEDAGLAAIAGHCPQELVLDDCPTITDAGLAHLEDSLSLARLVVRGCKLITEAGVQRLRQTMPECSIMWADELMPCSPPS